MKLVRMVLFQEDILNKIIETLDFQDAAAGSPSRARTPRPEPLILQFNCN